MTWLETLHQRHVVTRRIEVLTEQIAPLIHKEASVLDVGCGDGALAERLARLRPDLNLRGVDVILRPYSQIPVTQYDGKRLPLDDDSVDVVLLVDVIHHADSPEALLAEAARTARHKVIIKDHRLDGALAKMTLRFMDRLGNARYGVALPYSYWSEAEWRQRWAELGLRVDFFQSDLHLYPPPFTLLFDRGLHFLARLSSAEEHA